VDTPKYGWVERREDSSDYFRERVSWVVERLGLEEATRQARVSKPTMLRWASGESLPHPHFRPYVLAWVDRVERGESTSGL
jgi:hypothetical protein